MTRKELKDFKYTQEWIKEQLEYIEELKAVTEKTTSTLSDMPRGTSPIQDKMAENVAKLQDCINNMLEKVLESNVQQEQILNQLEQIEEPYRLILEKTYIRGKSLVEVACEMRYNYEYTKKMNSIALKKFEEVSGK